MAEEKVSICNGLTVSLLENVTLVLATHPLRFACQGGNPVLPAPRGLKAHFALSSSVLVSAPTLSFSKAEKTECPGYHVSPLPCVTVRRDALPLGLK